MDSRPRRKTGKDIERKRGINTRTGHPATTDTDIQEIYADMDTWKDRLENHTDILIESKLFVYLSAFLCV